jgi:purine nucleoside phosphorylase
VPDQLIDYTYGRENTFLGEETSTEAFCFAHPYSETLRERILSQDKKVDIALHHSATYGIVQGPRLETLAEVKKLERDGCHIVGRTGMPEATLARELELDYACIALVVREAGSCIDKAEVAQVTSGEESAQRLIEAIIRAF